MLRLIPEVEEDHLVVVDGGGLLQELDYPLNFLLNTPHRLGGFI